MGKKKKQKLIDWQEEQTKADPPKEDVAKVFAKRKPKKPMIRSSHR